MKIDILTLFPNMFKGPFAESIVKRAQEKDLVKIKIHNLRKWARDRHKTVDDRPFGGGTGMVLMIEPIFKAIQSLKSKSSLREIPSEYKNQKSKTHSKNKQSLFSRKLKNKKIKEKTILLTPQGQTFDQKKAQTLSKLDRLVLICGHYEGVDERVREHLVDEEISIGDYVLTGGELPAMVLVDTIVRLIPGVLEKPEAIQFESFSKLKIGKLKIENLLEYPQYTRPANFKGWKAPEVLLSGNHQKIAEWRKKKSLERTKVRRPDLLKA